MTQQSACREWVFTWHHSSLSDMDEQMDEDEAKKYMIKRMRRWPDVKYLVAGWETCPQKGGKHFQGFVSFTQRKRFTALNKLENKQVWFEKKAEKSTWDDIYNYVTKEDKSPFVLGNLPKIVSNGQREKIDWEDAWLNAKEGKLESIRADLRVKYYNAFKRIAMDNMRSVDMLDSYNNEWIVGVPGSGKSTAARGENPGCFPKSANQWWCGYQGEDCVIIEDLDENTCKPLTRELKIWLDKWDFIAQTKGGNMRIRPKKIVITSNYTIEECFNSTDAAAIRRRCRVRVFDNFKEYTESGEEVERPIPAATPAQARSLPAAVSTGAPTIRLDESSEEEEESDDSFSVSEPIVRSKKRKNPQPRLDFGYDDDSQIEEDLAAEVERLEKDYNETITWD